jgi:hypothetical protein
MWSYEVPRGRKNPIKHAEEVEQHGLGWMCWHLVWDQGEGCHWSLPLSVSKTFKGHTRAESSENRVNVIYTGAWARVELRWDETGLWSSLHQIQLSAHASVPRCTDKTHRHFKWRLVFQLLSYQWFPHCIPLKLVWFIGRWELWLHPNIRVRNYYSGIRSLKYYYYHHHHQY